MKSQRQLGFEIRTLNNCVKRFFQATKPPELQQSTGVHGWAIKYFYENRNKDIFQPFLIFDKKRNHKKWHQTINPHLHKCLS